MQNAQRKEEYYELTKLLGVQKSDLETDEEYEKKAFPYIINSIENLMPLDAKLNSVVKKDNYIDESLSKQLVKETTLTSVKKVLTYKDENGVEHYRNTWGAKEIIENLKFYSNCLYEAFSISFLQKCWNKEKR